MKNLLLISAMAMCATGATAQSAVTHVKDANIPTQSLSALTLNCQRPAMEVRSKAANLTTKAQKARRRTGATGLYYSRPVGTYFWGWNLEGRGRAEDVVVVPAFDEVVFENHSDRPSATSWQIKTPQGVFTLEDYTDEENNMHWMIEPGTMMYPFELSNAQGETYVLGQNFNMYYIDPSINCDYPSMTAAPDNLVYMGAYSGHSNVSYVLGGLDSGYLFGTGAITFGPESSAALGIEEGSYEMRGVITEYDKPASPLYVENLYAEIFTYFEEPIPAGTEITAIVANAETGEQIAILKATSDDLYEMGDQAYGNSPTGNIYWKILNFTQYSKGILGDLVKTPFVIDCPYTIEILGFDQEEVSFGFVGGKNGDGGNPENPVFEEPVRDSYAIFTDAAGQPFAHPLYGSGSGWDGATINIQLNALFDKVNVLINSQGTDAEQNPVFFENLNEVEVAVDGTSSVNYGIESYPGAIVYTACPWFDEETETENYTAAELPEWILEVLVDDSGWQEYAGECVVAFSAEPLPAGVAGRGALVYIEGRGVTASEPIFVFQGDREAALKDIPEGINTVLAPKAPKGIYNLAGQRATNAKGLLIENGKKILR